MLGRGKNSVKEDSQEKPAEQIELSDKKHVLKLCSSAKLHSKKDKKEFVITVNKKVIATGSNESATWKRALRSLL